MSHTTDTDPPARPGRRRADLLGRVRGARAGATSSARTWCWSRCARSVSRPPSSAPTGSSRTTPEAKARTLAAAGLRAVGQFVPVVLHDPASDPLPEVVLAMEALVAAQASTVVIAAATGAQGYDERPVLDDAQLGDPAGQPRPDLATPRRARPARDPAPPRRHHGRDGRRDRPRAGRKPHRPLPRHRAPADRRGRPRRASPSSTPRGSATSTSRTCASTSPGACGVASSTYTEGVAQGMYVPARCRATSTSPRSCGPSRATATPGGTCSSRTRSSPGPPPTPGSTRGPTCAPRWRTSWRSPTRWRPPRERLRRRERRDARGRRDGPHRCRHLPAAARGRAGGRQHLPEVPRRQRHATSPSPPPATATPCAWSPAPATTPSGATCGWRPRDLGVDPHLRARRRPGPPTPVTFCEIFPPDDFPLYFYRYPIAPDLLIEARRAAAGRRSATRRCSGPPSPACRRSPRRSAHHAAWAARGRRAAHGPRPRLPADVLARPRARPRPRWAERSSTCTVAVGNREECEVAVGETDPHRAADALLDRGVELAVVKQGPRACSPPTRDERVEVAAVPGRGRQRARCR